jgi:hypothetical protein
MLDSKVPLSLIKKNKLITIKPIKHISSIIRVFSMPAKSITKVDHDLRTHGAGTSPSEHPGKRTPHQSTCFTHGHPTAFEASSNTDLLSRWEGKGGGGTNHVAFVCLGLVWMRRGRAV